MSLSLNHPKLQALLFTIKNDFSYMKKSFVFAATIIFAFLMTSCFSIETDKQKEEREKESIQDEINEDLNEAKEDLNDALDNLGDAFKGLKKKHNIDEKDPINFRDLKKVLPKRLAGIDLEESEGQTSGVLGFKISTIQATYEEDDTRFEVSLVDVAGVGKLVKNMANWTEFEVDKETRDGYERTTEIDGHPALEKYNERRERGETSILIEDRFIISVKGRGVSERQMRRAIKDINLRKLARLGD
jgi:hypothetical protein